MNRLTVPENFFYDEIIKMNNDSWLFNIFS